ncbi:MAG: glycosyltransferase [bacterium]|nr:glycosyltransferase [bacterium]
MNLGVFLAIGESLTDFKSKGQLKRLTNYNIRAYSKVFDNVYIFSYANEKGFTLPKNCKLIPNSTKLHRYIYSLFLPLLKRGEIKECHVLRGLQISGGIPAIVAKILYKKRYVINYGYDYAKFAAIEDKPVQSFLYKLIESPLVKFADAVIVTSIEIRKKLIRKIKSKKVYLLRNGVDTKLFKPLKRKHHRKLTIMYLGRLVKQKNLSALLEGVKSQKNVRVIFFGEGPQKNYLMNLARKHQISLQIRKPVFWEKIPKILTLADIFVLPSLHEGNPKILLEAMSCAKAVIGANVEGIRELIKNGENGLLCEKDPRSIESAINKLKSLNLRQKLGTSARKYVLENFDIEKILKKEVNLLKNLAKNE